MGLKNLLQTECLQTSALTGILGGSTIGLVYFILTSRTKRLPKVTAGSMLLCFTLSWFPCRYKYYQGEYLMHKIEMRSHQMRNNQAPQDDSDPVLEVKIDDA